MFLTRGEGSVIVCRACEEPTRWANVSTVPESKVPNKHEERVLFGKYRRHSFPPTFGVGQHLINLFNLKLETPEGGEKLKLPTV